MINRVKSLIGFKLKKKLLLYAFCRSLEFFFSIYKHVSDRIIVILSLSI